MAGVPQGSIPLPLFPFIYNNDLSDNLLSTAELFANDTLFSVANEYSVSVNVLYKDLQKISKWG